MFIIQHQTVGLCLGIIIANAKCCLRKYEKKGLCESSLFPYKPFYNHHFVPTNLRSYVISGGKVCSDLISTLDSNQKERIPGVCGAGSRRALTHATLGAELVKGRWLVAPGLPGPGPHCSGNPGPGHMSMSTCQLRNRRQSEDMQT